MTSILREGAIRVVLVVMSCLVALLLVELIARAFFSISDGRDNITLDGKPVKGWFEPSTVYRQVTNEYDAITTITDKGHRVPGVEGNPDIIFVGDSFTYGFGLSDDETFASIYCKAQQHECVNLGKPGSGTSQQIDRLTQFIAVWGWKPKEVKLFFFGMSGSFSAGNDFVDNYNTYLSQHGKDVSSAQLGEDLRAARGSSAGLAERVIAMQEDLLHNSMLIRLAKFYWGPMLKRMVVAEPGEERMNVALIATKEYLARLHSMSHRLGFDYSIYLIVPVHDIMRGTFSETLATLNSVSPKPVIATAQLFLDEPKKYYYAFDGHINAAGSRRIAEFLASSESALVINGQRQ